MAMRRIVTTMKRTLLALTLIAAAGTAYAQRGRIGPDLGVKRANADAFGRRPADEPHPRSASLVSISG
jgi:hypothetical protein